MSIDTCNFVVPGGLIFSYSNWLSISSADKIYSPSTINIFYNDKKPGGKLFFDLISSRKNIKIINIQSIKYFFPNDYTLKLYIIYIMGGIILDINTISLKKIEYKKICIIQSSQKFPIIACKKECDFISNIFSCVDITIKDKISKNCLSVEYWLTGLNLSEKEYNTSYAYKIDETSKYLIDNDKYKNSNFLSLINNYEKKSNKDKNMNLIDECDLFENLSLTVPTKQTIIICIRGYVKNSLDSYNMGDNPLIILLSELSKKYTLELYIHTWKFKYKNKENGEVIYDHVFKSFKEFGFKKLLITEPIINNYEEDNHIKDPMDKNVWYNEWLSINEINNEMIKSVNPNKTVISIRFDFFFCGGYITTYDTDISHVINFIDENYENDIENIHFTKTRRGDILSRGCDYIFIGQLYKLLCMSEILINHIEIPKKYVMPHISCINYKMDAVILYISDIISGGIVTHIGVNQDVNFIINKIIMNYESILGEI